MFRYIALTWDPAQPSPSAAAYRFIERWRARSGWDVALDRAGLQVYTTGTCVGRNEALLLPDGRGVVLGKAFRRSELASMPGRSVPFAPKDGARVLASLGASLVREFWGRYVAMFETDGQSVHVLRDPTGTLPCFRVTREGVSIVFSWLEDALQLLNDLAPRAVSQDALSALLLRGVLSGRETLLEGVSEVLAGERFDPRSGDSTMLWAAVDFARHPLHWDAQTAIRALRETVRGCTRAWAACYPTALMRLSGGVDSSIVLSCLSSEHCSADIIAVNYHSEGSDSDERVYARLMAKQAGRLLVERERDAGFRIERVLKAARMPAPVAYIGWMNAASDAHLADIHAAPAILSGTGGDLVFYEFPRWWTAADYLSDRGLDAGFPTAAMDAARLGRVSVWHAAAKAWRERLRQDPALRQFGGFTDLLGPALTEVKRPPSRLWHRALRATVPDRRRFLHPLHDALNQLPIGKFMQTFGLMYPLGYYDPFEQARTPELVNPLLSQPVVELCLRLPTYLLTAGGRGRALARQAFSHDLPPEIANRRSKGGMEEHLKAILEHNRALVRELLLDGEMIQRGLLDRARLDTLLSGKPTALLGAPAQLHELVAIEAWLSRWRS